jgi:hypothetical protein
MSDQPKTIEVAKESDNKVSAPFVLNPSDKLKNKNNNENQAPVIPSIPTGGNQPE